MTKISVVIPSADRADLLERAINSVLSQTAEASEIIVVDNGKKQVSLPTGMKSSVSILRTAPRIGPSRARNFGANKSLSDYVAFLDDDDVWDPNYLCKCKRVIERQGAGVVVGKLKRQLLDSDQTQDYKLFPHEVLEQRAIYFRNPGFGGQNLVIRRDIFLQLGGFDENMPASEDRDLAARIIEAGYKIYVEPEAVSILCDHRGARMRSNVIRGNFMFIKKHWRKMRASELLQACTTLARRYVKASLS